MLLQQNDKPTVSLLLLIFTAVFLFFSPRAFAQNNSSNFSIDVPYDVAVQGFLLETTNAIAENASATTLDDIDIYQDNLHGELPTFLEDMLLIARQLEASGDSEFVFEQYTDFAQRWQDIVYTYPEFNEIVPVLDPLLEELVAGLPQLEENQGENPVNNLFSYYQRMVELNPWGAGSFFVLEPLPVETKGKNIFEVKRELIQQGIRQVRILSRQTRVTKNGVNVYLEIVADDELLVREVEYRSPTLIHDIAEQMQLNQEEPALIAIIEELAQLLETNVQLAVDNNILDECSRDYLYRSEEANQNKACADITFAQQNVDDMYAFDPFDDVSQTRLHEQNFSQLSSAELSGLSLLEDTNNEALKEYSKATENAAGVWIMGILIPTYLYSLVGLLKMFI